MVSNMNCIYLWNKILKKMRGCAIRNSQIHSTSKVEAGSHVVNSTMDKYSFCGYDCKIINCKIGSFCSIADEVIIGGAQHPIEWVSTSPVFYKGRDSVKKKFSEFDRPEEPHTIIENDVWIGDRAIIKGGVHIGNGAVIGMGSVVTKDVGDYEIWAGNPARCIRKRFSPDVSEALNSMRWWNLSEKELAKDAVNIRFPEKFLNEKQ